jgi:hypothetical protein
MSEQVCSRHLFLLSCLALHALQEFPPLAAVSLKLHRGDTEVKGVSDKFAAEEAKADNEIKATAETKGAAGAKAESEAKATAEASVKAETKAAAALKAASGKISLSSQPLCSARSPGLALNPATATALPLPPLLPHLPFSHPQQKFARNLRAVR